MPKVRTLLAASGTVGFTPGLSARWYQLAQNHQASRTTESQASLPVRAAFTLKNFRVTVYANTLDLSTVTYLVRKNAGDGTSTVAVGPGLTGVFEDTSHTDSFADGDTLTIQGSSSAGGTGSMTARYVAAWAEEAVDAPTTRLGVSNNDADFSAASTTYFAPLCGSATTALTGTEADCKFPIRSTQTAKKLRIRVTVNTRSTSTAIKSRKNGGDGGQSVSVGSGLTGVFEDTSGTDSLVSGDDICWAGTTGTGSGVVRFNTFAMDLLSANRKWEMGAQSDVGIAINGAADLVLYPIGLAGQMGTVPDINGQLRMPTKARVTNLRLKVSANADATQTNLYVRKNGSNTGLTVAITGSGTGTFEDTTNNVFFATDDLLSLFFDGAGSGNITITGVFLTVDALHDAPNIARAA